MREARRRDAGEASEAVTIIDLQRRLVEVGRIRMGATVPTATGTRPVKLERWRLTSRDEARLRAAADLFGGSVEPWGDRPGEHELMTEVDELPIMLMPGQAISQHYEVWSGGGCKRRCDGATEMLSDGPCLCDPDARECKPHTRLSVMLPDVPGLGCWRLDTSGYYAAVELSATVEFLEGATARGVLLPARLRIDQRSILRDGQTKRFAVPVVDVDIRMLDVASIAASSTSLGDGERSPSLALPSGYRPLMPNGGGVSVDQALTATAQQRAPSARTARSAAPLAPVGDADVFSDEPLAVETDAAIAPGVEPITDAQKRKLNVLVGQLRGAGHITTEQLYRATQHEPVPADDLHWSPLRDALTKSEAHDLIDRLEALDARIA